MSRTVPAPIQTEIDAGSPTLTWAIVVTREDGTAYRWTTHNRMIEIGGNQYTPEPGIEVNSIAMSAGFGVDNTECRINATDTITRQDLIAGRWDAAEFSLFIVNWKTPTDGVIEFLTGTLGNLQARLGFFVTELRDIRQAIQPDTTDVVQADCRYRLGDAKCTIDLSDTDAGWTVIGEITSVTSRYLFADSGRAEADDFFGAGEIRFTTGLNAGLRFHVREYVGASGAFTLSLQTPFNVTIGDEYVAIAGCRKRHVEDCVTKFANGINFGGEPHKARVDFLLRGAP